MPKGCPSGRQSLRACKECFNKKQITLEHAVTRLQAAMVADNQSDLFSRPEP